MSGESNQYRPFAFGPVFTGLFALQGFAGKGLRGCFPTYFPHKPPDAAVGVGLKVLSNGELWCAPTASFRHQVRRLPSDVAQTLLVEEAPRTIPRSRRFCIPYDPADDAGDRQILDRWEQRDG
jgi:hypothetical protein